MPEKEESRSTFVEGCTVCAELPIRVRRVLDETGDVPDRQTVFCPVRVRSIPVEVCLACARARKVTLAPEREASVQCDIGAEGVSLVPEDPHDAPIGSIMSRLVECVTASTTIGHVIDLLLGHGYGGVPVVNEVGRAIGIVAKTDLVRRDHALDEPVETIMMPVAFSLPEHASIGRAAALMASEGIHRLPVHDEDGAVVGIVTPLDITRWVARRAGYAL